MFMHHQRHLVFHYKGLEFLSLLYADISYTMIALWSEEAATHQAGISQGMCPANEKRRYNVTTSLIGCGHT